jgi:phosphate/sulfate permease
MPMSLTQWVLSAIYVAALLTILVFMQKRRARASFPIFFNYIVCTLVMYLFIVICTFLPCPKYFYVYWTLTAVNTLLVFGVLYEVFANAMSPFSAVIDLGRMLFRWAAIFLLVTAVLTATVTGGNQPSKLMAALLLLERSCDLMQCGLLLLLVTFQAKLGISWRSRSMCIALGLGTYAATDLLISYVGAHFPGWAPQLDLANGLVSVGMFGFLAASFLIPEPERRRAQDSPQRLILQRWNDVLGSYGYAAGAVASSSMADSFIPGVEQAVERVMSRKMVH